MADELEPPEPGEAELPPTVPPEREIPMDEEPPFEGLIRLAPEPDDPDRPYTIDLGAAPSSDPEG